MVELVRFVVECGEDFFYTEFQRNITGETCGKELNEWVEVLKIRVVFLRGSPFCLPSLSLAVTTAAQFYVEAKLRNGIWQRTFLLEDYLFTYDRLLVPLKLKVTLPRFVIVSSLHKAIFYSLANNHTHNGDIFLFICFSFHVLWKRDLLS